jgi:hypothetical protein
MIWQVRLGVIFLVVAILVNCIHYLVFRDSEYIFKFILAQLGFLPISVFLVTVVINQLLGKREKMLMLNKLNMVIGSFFSEVGTQLLRFIAVSDKHIDQFRDLMLVRAGWSESEYERVAGKTAVHDFSIAGEMVQWQELQAFLSAKKEFLLTLLANPNLLEHESFTELLWAVFHLAEELDCRSGFEGMLPSDRDHLVGDIDRAYRLLITEWLNYMRHLQIEYPYLFSLAMRTNPFDIAARPEVE